MPAWLLLAWSGLAAALVSACVRALLAFPREGSAFRRLVGATVLGLFVLPVVYGFAFEAIGRADLMTGALLGLLHGLIEAAVLFRSATPANRRRAIAQGLLGGLSYGVAIGFLYLVPA